MSENLSYYVGYAHQMLTMWLYPVPDKQYTLEILMKVLPLTLHDTQDSILPAVFEKYYVPLFYLATAELYRLNQMYQEAEREENEALKIATIYKKMFAPPVPSIIPLKYQLFKRKSDVPCSLLGASSVGSGSGSDSGSGDGSSDDDSSDSGDDNYVILTLYFDPLQGDVSREPAGEMIAPNQIRYLPNTSVQLIPVPYPPKEFYYWTVNANVNFYSPLNIIMDTNKIVEAIFTNDWEKVLIFEYGNEAVGEIFLQFGDSGSFIIPPSIYHLPQNTFVSIQAQNIPDGYVFEKYEFWERNPNGSIGSLLNTITSTSHSFILDRSYLIKFFVRQSETYQLSIIITNWDFITGDQIIRNPLGETIYEGLYKYPAGTSVSLVPSPVFGNSFVYWRYPVWTGSGYTEVVSDEVPLILTMDRNKFAEGIFIGPSRKVIKIAHGNDPVGDVRIHYYIDESVWVENLIPASNLPYWEIVANNTVITLTAENLPSGYILEKWKVYERNPDGTQGAFLLETNLNPITIVANTGKIIYKYVSYTGDSGSDTGEDSSESYVILTIWTDFEFGEIIREPSGTPISLYQFQYPANTVVALSNIPNTGFEFSHWYIYPDERIFIYSPLHLLLNSNKTVYATFTSSKVLAFDYGALEVGQVEVSETGDYISYIYNPPNVSYANLGTSITIRAIIPSGYEFEKWEFYERNPDGTVGNLVNVVYNPVHTFIVDRSYLIKMYVDIFALP